MTALIIGGVWLAVLLLMLSSPRGRRTLTRAVTDIGHVWGFEPRPTKATTPWQVRATRRPSGAELAAKRWTAQSAKVSEDWLIRQAREDYATGRLSLDGLNERLDAILNPPKPITLNEVMAARMTTAEATRRLQGIAEYERLKRESEDAHRSFMEAPITNAATARIVPITSSLPWTAVPTPEAVTLYDANGKERTVLRKPLPTEPDPRLVQYRESG